MAASGCRAPVVPLMLVFSHRSKSDVACVSLFSSTSSLISEAENGSRRFRGGRTYTRIFILRLISSAEWSCLHLNTNAGKNQGAAPPGLLKNECGSWKILKSEWSSVHTSEFLFSSEMIYWLVDSFQGEYLLKQCRGNVWKMEAQDKRKVTGQTSSAHLHALSALPSTCPALFM